MSQEQFFVEQAEYIEDEEFNKWSAVHPNEKNIIRKLTQGGAKLISGPRGCGKTTLLLKAKHAMLDDNAFAFPIYVNFKRSLSMEPLYKSDTDGTFWFNQWIILKIYQGVYATLDAFKSHVDLSVGRDDANLFAEYLEMGRVDKAGGISLTVSDVDRDINKAFSKCGRDKAVLLLDDAAHAFSPDQQKDFFDFFRQVKSARISPKAAVYPGVTNYSASFHIGHDAESIDVWIKPDDDKYLEFMVGLVQARFPEVVVNKLLIDEPSLHLMCYAAFGVPRALINMVQDLVTYGEDGDIEEVVFSRRDAIKSIKAHYKKTIALFSQLRNKVPAYKNFIDEGVEVVARSIGYIKQYNKDKGIKSQSVSIAISEADLGSELSRLFGFFQYAGLCIPKEEFISRGEKGRFQIFTMHYAGLIDANALIGAKAVSSSDYVEAFRSRSAHEFTRVSARKILDGADVDAILALSMPDCAFCGSPRAHKDARFCINCGSALTTGSTYNDLINRNIEELALTPKRVQKIKEQSTIRKIKDILMDHEHKKLLAVDRVGQYWATRIAALAEEFVE